MAESVEFVAAGPQIIASKIESLCSIKLPGLVALDLLSHPVLSVLQTGVRSLGIDRCRVSLFFSHGEEEDDDQPAWRTTARGRVVSGERRQVVGGPDSGLDAVQSGRGSSRGPAR